MKDGPKNKGNGTILVIDDEKIIRRSLHEILKYEGYEVEEAEDGVEGEKKIMERDYECIICDIRMPRMNGMQLLKSVHITKPEIPFIIVSAHADIELAVEAVKEGAYDCVPKPPDIGRLLASVRTAIADAQRVGEPRNIKAKLERSKTAVNMIGESPQMETIRETILKVAQTDARVLVLGPNGCGKELVARAIHAASKRAKGPFIDVNCAAIPSELIESELFGHEKGSFTSAFKQRIGRFELASGGTIFLDEVGDMSPAAQAKVLRVLQESRICRVGSEKDIPVDVRIVAATNKDLKNEADRGNFRLDLFHRLGVILIEVPPLNERRTDVPLLINHFMKELSAIYEKPIRPIANDAIEYIANFEFTGNVRELRNVIERLIILTNDDITLADVKKYM